MALEHNRKSNSEDKHGQEQYLHREMLRRGRGCSRGSTCLVPTRSEDTIKEGTPSLERTGKEKIHRKQRYS